MCATCPRAGWVERLHRSPERLTKQARTAAASGTRTGSRAVTSRRRRWSTGAVHQRGQWLTPWPRWAGEDPGAERLRHEPVRVDRPVGADGRADASRSPTSSTCLPSPSRTPSAPTSDRSWDAAATPSSWCVSTSVPGRSPQPATLSALARSPRFVTEPESACGGSDPAGSRGSRGSGMRPGPRRERIRRGSCGGVSRPARSSCRSGTRTLRPYASF